MTLDAFLKAAWNDHADHAQAVADRLAASMHLVQAPADVRAYAGLLAHVYGEHLGQWRQGIALLGRLRHAPGFDGSQDAEAPVGRWTATLRFVAREPDVLQPLSVEDRTVVLANAAAMFAGRGDLRSAIDAYDHALRLAHGGLPPGSPAFRSLAVGGNNLAAALEAQPDLGPAEVEGMVAAAEGALTSWRLAGTWLEEERAEYRLTRSLLKAGRAHAAIASARRCIEVCIRNEAPAFERFFGHAVLALALRAAGDQEAFAAERGRALAQLALVSADEKAWCERECKELG
jgi:tetratricopeptide (TPR) repeat protein